MGFQKITKSQNLAYLRILRAKKVQQISALWVEYKKVIETQKCNQAA